MLTETMTLQTAAYLLRRAESAYNRSLIVQKYHDMFTPVLVFNMIIALVALAFQFIVSAYNIKSYVFLDIFCTIVCVTFILCKIDDVLFLLPSVYIAETEKKKAYFLYESIASMELAQL